MHFWSASIHIAHPGGGGTTKSATLSVGVSMIAAGRGHLPKDRCDSVLPNTSPSATPNVGSTYKSTSPQAAYCIEALHTAMGTALA